MKKRIFPICFMVVSCFLIGACKSGRPDSQKVDLTSVPLATIIQNAQEEGIIESVGMPANWANWGASWFALDHKYGIKHNDIDLSSAEEISTFEVERYSPTKDIGDVGYSFGKIVVEKDLVQAYKASVWESIPSWAKDPQGRWVVSYTGTISLITNTKLVKDAPRRWSDILDGDYKITPGDVVRGASSQIAVLSAALAFGGSLENVQPGIDFFVNLAKEGRIDPGEISEGRMAKGEVAVGLHFDFAGLSWRESIGEINPDLMVETHIPQDGAVQSGYCLIINKYAPHPYAAALAVEYMLSDEGQIDRANGFARPIRSDVKIPDEIQAKLIPDVEYQNVYTSSDIDAINKACSEISRLWEEEVIPNMK